MGSGTGSRERILLLPAAAFAAVVVVLPVLRVVALSLSQTVAVVGAIVVTTPQKVSLADSRRAIKMYEKLTIPTICVV